VLQYDISRLFEHTLSQMPDRFDSHQLILRLAQENQRFYIEALNLYLDAESPFMVLHDELAKHLQEYPELIKQVSTVHSKNIFGQVNACAVWEKIV
jgi:hypothetical protein